MLETHCGRRSAAVDNPFLSFHEANDDCQLTPEHIQDRSTDNLEVSVVMPCLNEALTVGRCIDKARSALDEMGVHGEVLIADNGSGDGSPDIAREHGARVVHVPRKGYGAALQAGIGAAKGRFIIMGDADDSYDFTQLSPFVARLRAGRRSGHGQSLSRRHQAGSHALAPSNTSAIRC